MVLPNPQLATHWASQAWLAQAVVHRSWLKNPQIMVLKKEGGFNKGFLSYKYLQSPLLRNYRHPVQFWSKVHMCCGHGGEDEGQDAEDFHDDGGDNDSDCAELGGVAAYIGEL